MDAIIEPTTGYPNPNDRLPNIFGCRSEAMCYL